MEQDIYDEMAKQEGQHWWFVARRKYVQKLISKYFPPDSKYRVCEIGCGTGGNLEMLSQLGCVDAVELNESARQVAKSKEIKNVLGVCSGYLPDGIPLTEKYDGVFSLDVIEHVENDLEAVKALKSLIAENGRLIVTVPAYQWLWSAHDEVNHHFRRYSKKTFLELFDSAGLKIRYVSYFNSILFPLALLSRITEKISPNKTATKTWGVKYPSVWVNALLKKIFELESIWAGKFSIPFGLSIVVVAELEKE